MKTFTLKSQDLGGVASPDQRHPAIGGGNISPALSWENPPPGTRSYALTIHDADAPTGSGFWHWLVVNIPPHISGLPAKAGNTEQQLMPPEAVQTKNDAGTYGYTGSCPPAGDGWHQYLITVYALDVDSLPVGRDTLAAQVGFTLWQHTLQKASLVFYDMVKAE